jgi:agmatinase
VRRWLEVGSLTVVLGGDDSIPIPVLAAFRDHGPVSVLHIDAHLDYRDEVDGERYGYSSPMRRVREMPWVRRIHHVGQRGVGSARPTDVEDTIDAGGRITTAGALRDGGVRPVIDSFAAGEAFVIVLDVDGIDPADVPAVRAPSPGGPSFLTVLELLRGVARRADCRGLVVTELEPALDINGLSSRIVCRLICGLLDAALLP